MTAQVAADLRAAAEVLKRDGWTQGEFHRPDGCHCVEGAIALAVGFHKNVRPAPDPQRRFATWDEDYDNGERRYDDAYFHLARALGVRVVYDWNDAPGRTAAEVIAALRAAADAAEAQP